MKESLVMIQTTTNSLETAQKIASQLLELRKAACVQIQNIESHYHWNGKLVSDKELLITAKTTKSHAHEVMNLLKQLHNYSLPEIVQINVDETTTEYLSWVVKETKKPIAH